MPLSTTVALSRIRNRGWLRRPLSYAAPKRGSVGTALDHASVMIHPITKRALDFSSTFLRPHKYGLENDVSIFVTNFDHIMKKFIGQFW